jgi:peptidoglycan/xylan/chitin deacetylase (PgdA/CDA1 family)
MTDWKSSLLGCYYYGTLPYRRWYRRRAAAAGRMPLVVLFYHRVADDRANGWTTSPEVFRRHIRWLKSHCELVSMAEIQRRMRAGANGRPAASITFDDGYAENCREAIPFLLREKVPCTYFVSVGNVLSGQGFPHDLVHGNHFPPNTLDELRAMAGAGVEIGAHGYWHADLGAITDPETLEREVLAAGESLARALDRTVRYFAFPFGLWENLNLQAFRLARGAGYQGVCSAYGGYNFPGDDPFQIRRIHADDGLLRLKNWVTIDPRKLAVPRFEFDQPEGLSPCDCCQEVAAS